MILPLIDPCAGPNHGSLDALPKGYRIWMPGNCISLIQMVEDGPRSQMVFCSADCMCDWHGAACAMAHDHADVPDFHVPGTFTLFWISPEKTSYHVYEDFDAFTTKITSYQSALFKILDNTPSGPEPQKPEDLTL